MLLRHRVPRIESLAGATNDGFEHLDQESITLLRWLKVNRIDFVLVGPVALAIRGEIGAEGPVAIVPAPYGRNLDRLLHALHGTHARLRLDGRPEGAVEPATMRPDEERRALPGEAGGPLGPKLVKMTAEKLVRGQRWTLRCGAHDIDIEGRPRGVPRYQELLYEAGRFELAPELSVEVASPEDLEHYEHIRRTGISPQMQITRSAPVQQT